MIDLKKFSGKDKLYHFLAGVAIFFLCVIFFAVFNIGANDQWFSPSGLAFIITWFVGLGKELVWDVWIKKSYFDVYDWLATGAGGLAGVIILLPF